VKHTGNLTVIGDTMEVRLKQPWMGHHAGAIVKLSESYANTLFQSDTAEKVEPETIENIRKKLQDILVENLLRSPPINEDIV
jgi:hypothetical protein